MTTEIAAGAQPTPEAPPPALDAFGFGPEEIAPAAQPSPAPASNGNGAAPAPEAKPVETPAGEPPEDGEVLIDDKGQVRDAKSGRFVPHAKFHQAREKAKALEAELGEVKAKWTRADERLAVLNEALKGGQAPADGKGGNDKAAGNPWDEPDVDPQADIFKAFDQERRRNAWLRTHADKSIGEAQEQIANREIQNYYRQAQAKLPDYKEAHAHLTDFMHRELEAVYGVTDRAKRQEIIDDRERETVLEAVRAKRDPAQRIYQLATVRGYAKKAAPEQKPAGEQRIEQIKNGQAAAGTLANAAGGPSAPLSLEALVSLSDDEYYERAKALGKGNASLGIKLLQQAVRG